jgi:hypothetical protein
MGVVPFTLGVPFQLELTTSSTVTAQPGVPAAGAAGSGEVHLQLFEEGPDGGRGGSVEILGPVPEPGQFVPVAALLCGALWWLHRKQLAHQA